MAGLRMLAASVAFAAAAWTAAGQSSPAPTPAIVATDPSFRLGADDVIQIHAVEVEEISDKPTRIGPDGNISLPVVGRIKAAGLTTEELQTEIAERLKRLIVHPDVAVSVVETHSQPVSVVGAVKTPGVIQLQGHKTLLEVLSLAGGPRDDSGYTATITRQKEFGLISLPNAAVDSTGQYSVAEVNLQNVMEARDPAGNIQIMPNDVISVPKAEMVYVIGEVMRPGGIALGNQKTVTVLQAVSIAAGLSKTAKSTEAKILRLMPGSPKRTEVAVNLKTMLAGKTDDVPMRPDDILFVPNSLKKDLGLRTLEALGGTGVSSVIYRVP